jgi:hypothetical protein
MTLTTREAELREQFEKNRVQFLLTELDTGATFCNVAQTSNDPEKTQRNIGNARTAYDTILKFQEGVRLDANTKDEFEQKFAHLRSLLKELGQDV